MRSSNQHKFDCSRDYHFWYRGWPSRRILPNDCCLPAGARHVGRRRQLSRIPISDNRVANLKHADLYSKRRRLYHDFEPVTRKISETLIWLLIVLVMIIVLAAGLLKDLTFTTFRQSLDSWVLLPPIVRNIAAFTVPTLEIFLSASWFFGPRRAWVLWSATALLTSFAVVYAAHVVTVGPPTCNCLGPLLQFNTSRWLSVEIVVRNFLMCAPLVIGALRIQSYRALQGGRS